jgi:signal transduction histidine kinase
MNEGAGSRVERITHQILCLKIISKLLADSKKDVHNILNTLVHLLPEGWQYPSNTCARVVWGDMTVESVNFKDTKWKQSVELRTGDKVIGTLDICYLEEKPDVEEGPFLDDERSLLETVAAELGSYLDYKRLERLHNQQRRELELYASLLRHDLRNDVGVIIGNVEITKLTITNRGEILDQMIASTEAVCERMMGLLNIFGRAAKIADTDLLTIVKKIAEQSIEASMGMQVTVDIAEDVKEAKIVESKLLPLVFDNLLRNAAVHAGESPKVQIIITRQERLLKILVVDDGPGVAEEIREQLFNKGVSTRDGGLGLYLSRHVVETMGGSIQLIESDPGMGATFEITLPIIN